MFRRVPVAFAAALLLVPTAAADTDPRLALRTAAALYDGIRTERLANGLQVYLKPIPGSTAVTTMVVYKVGSADEDKTSTGLAHYLEHLMFKGTAKLKPGDIDRITFRAGGSNNAYTTTDMTAYHFTLPASRWLAALQVEADRMRNLRIDKEHEFDKEKGAVINELAGNEDMPWDLEYKAILPLTYGKKHPYGHPVIGEAKHVKDADEKTIKAFYDRWYHPNNASLILVGGFDADEALAAIKKLFTDIPRGKLPERKTLPAETPKLPARLEMPSKFSVPRLLVTFPTVRIGDPDQAALGVLEAVLGRGKRSRLYRTLVEGAAVASSASAEHSPGRYPGWLAVQVEVLPDKDRAAVEKAVLRELAKLRDEAVPAAELKRVQQQLLAAAVYAREGTYGLANSIGEAVTLADLDFARKYLPRLLAVTPADVQRVAKKYLDPARSATVWSVPAQAAPDGGGSASSFPRPPSSGGEGLGVRGAFRLAFRAPPHPQPSKGPPEAGARGARDGAVAGGFDLKKAQRVVLPSGLVVLLFENRRLPIFEAHAALREVNLHQPDDKLGVATLTGMMLDEGTAKRTGPQIAEAIETAGGVLSLHASGGSVRVLSPDRGLGLGLLLECLTQPAFEKEAFVRARARLLAEIREAESQPETRARRTFQRAVYGKHPLGRPASGTTATVRKLTPADLAAFHKKVFVPGNMILALVGDFDSKEVIAELKNLTSGWKKAELARAKLPEVARPEKFTESVLSMPEAAQLHFYLGHVGVRRNDPDFYRLLVMDYILGVGPGFTDRLSSRLRDREGLAYTVSASITQSAGVEPGMFTCYIGTDTGNFAKVKKLFLEELNRIRDTKPAALEVEDARTYLLGSQLLQFATCSGIAGQLLGIERHGLGFGYLEDFQKAIRAVTAEDVQAVAKKHIDPKRMVLVAAGAVDRDGKPLPKPGG
jgi:zinc protease